MAWNPYQDEYPSKNHRSSREKPRNTLLGVLDKIFTFVFFSVVLVVLGGFFIGFSAYFISSVRAGNTWNMVVYGGMAVFFGGCGLALIIAGVNFRKTGKHWEQYSAQEQRRKQAEEEARKLREQEPEPKPNEGRAPYVEAPPKSKPTFTPPPPEIPKQTPPIQERRYNPTEGRVPISEPPISKPALTPPSSEPPKQTPPVTGKRLHKQKVPLQKYPDDNRPIISIQLRYGDRTIDCDALIDSGATHTVFHSKFAEQLGVDLIALTNAPYQRLAGIAADAMVKGYRMQIELGVEDHFYPATVYFSFDLNPNALNMLGHEGFGEYFYWTRGDKYVEITDKAAFPMMFTLQKDK